MLNRLVVCYSSSCTRSVFNTELVGHPLLEALYGLGTEENRLITKAKCEHRVLSWSFEKSCPVLCSRKQLLRTLTNGPLMAFVKISLQTKPFVHLIKQCSGRETPGCAVARREHEDIPFSSYGWLQGPNQPAIRHRSTEELLVPY